MLYPKVICCNTLTWLLHYLHHNQFLKHSNMKYWKGNSHSNCTPCRLLESLWRFAFPWLISGLPSHNLWRLKVKHGLRQQLPVPWPLGCILLGAFLKQLPAEWNFEHFLYFLSIRQLIMITKMHQDAKALTCKSLEIIVRYISLWVSSA